MQGGIKPWIGIGQREIGSGEARAFGLTIAA